MGARGLLFWRFWGEMGAKKEPPANGTEGGAVAHSRRLVIVQNDYRGMARERQVRAGALLQKMLINSALQFADAGEAFDEITLGA